MLPLLVAAALYLPGIGRRLIYAGDEARYAILARTMLETGDWLVPRLSGEVRMAKTPLFIWSIAALSLPGGKVTELTAVLPAALSGIAGVGMTMLLARRMFGLRAALLTGFILATTWGYLGLARVALADMMVTFWVVASVAAFWEAVADGGASRRLPMALFWVCVAVGLAAKGPAPHAAPALWGVSVAEDGWSGLRKLRPLMGLAIVAAISTSWAVGSRPARGELRGDRAHQGLPASAPGGMAPLPGSDLRGRTDHRRVSAWTPCCPSRAGRLVASGARRWARRKFRFLVFWALA